VDRNTTSSYVNGKCLSKSGCYTFFPLQGSSMPTWMNAGTGAYHSLTITLRRAFSRDSRSTSTMRVTRDRSGVAAESGAGPQGAAIQNIFNTKEFRGSSDFDIAAQHQRQFSVRAFPSEEQDVVPRRARLVDQIIGNWQVSSVIRYRSGLPSTVAGDLAYNANYWLNSLAVLNAPVHPGVGIDQNGNPSIFGNTSTASSFEDEFPGHSGTPRARPPGAIFQHGSDAGQSFKLPWEHQRLQFRAEAFNAFNNVNFTNPSLSLLAR